MRYTIARWNVVLGSQLPVLQLGPPSVVPSLRVLTFLSATMFYLVLYTRVRCLRLWCAAALSASWEETGTLDYG